MARLEFGLMTVKSVKCLSTAYFVDQCEQKEKSTSASLVLKGTGVFKFVLRCCLVLPIHSNEL